MNRNKLKCGGSPRKKAFLGLDAGITAAATLAAASMNVAATAKAAKEQSKAMISNAKTQADSMLEQNRTNIQLQKENINFTKEQNEANRIQQRDTQATLQLLAGQQNMNEAYDAHKVQAKLGTKKKTKRTKLKSALFYGGANAPFKVTDGGGAIPVEIDDYGYGLYELFGNDHEHYHKTPNGKNKTGVGIKFADGTVVEGEGNQNTNKGEMIYVTPEDAMFISKHSIDGFNPREAVLSGMHPQEASDIQEYLKSINGLNDDGTMAKCGKRVSMKKLYGGNNILFNAANIRQIPNILPEASGIVYLVNDKNNSSKAKCGKRVSIKKANSRKKALFGTPNYFNTSTYENRPNPSTYRGNPLFKFVNKNFSNNSLNAGDNIFKPNYTGAIYNTIGNVGGSLLNFAGGLWAASKISNAAQRAAEINADAARRLQTIDDSFINKEDYSAAKSMAAIQSADTNVNPQLERNRRDRAAEMEAINRNTLSSAARQQRLSAVNDRYKQRASEIYQFKHNADDQIAQRNMATITQVSKENADRESQSIRDYTNAKLNLRQYNNNIINQRILGEAGAYASAETTSAEARAAALQNGMTGMGNALASSANAFASTYDSNLKFNRDFFNNYVGLNDMQQVRAALLSGNPNLIRRNYDMYKKGATEASKRHARMIEEWARRNNFKLV